MPIHPRQDPPAEAVAPSQDAREVDAELEGPSVYDSMRSSFVRVWSSVKLAVVLIVLIALGSIVGTVIPQGEPSNVLGISGMSEGAKHFLIWIRAYDVFYSPWYLGLLALFFFNLAVCTYVRVWPRLKFSLARPRELPEAVRERLPEQLKLAGVSVDRVQELLARRFYRTFETRDGGLAADRNRWFRFAPMVVHLGLFLILIGAITAGLAGFKDSFPLLPGDTMPVRQAMQAASRRGPLTPALGSWKIHLDKFWMTHYPGGAVKQYYSTLSVIDGGKTVLTRTIHVNDPLRYKGVWFYQSFYGIGAERLVVDRGIQTRILLTHQDGVSVKLAGFITTQFKLPAPLARSATAGHRRPEAFFYSAGAHRPFYLLDLANLDCLGSLAPGQPLELAGHTYALGPVTTAPGVAVVVLDVGGQRRTLPVASAGRFNLAGYISREFVVGQHQAFLYMPDPEGPVQIMDLRTLAPICKIALRQSADADGVTVAYRARKVTAAAGGLASATILQDGKPLRLQLVNLSMTGFQISGPASDPFEIGGKSVVAIQNADPAGSPLWLINTADQTAEAIMDPHHTVQIGHDVVTYRGPVWFSGLQTKSDPSIPVIYTGFITIILGAFLGMFSHRQLYVESTADGCKVAGKANRGQYLFHQELARMARELGVDAEEAFAAAAPAEAAPDARSAQAGGEEPGADPGAGHPSRIPGAIPQGELHGQ